MIRDEVCWRRRDDSEEYLVWDVGFGAAGAEHGPEAGEDEGQGWGGPAEPWGKGVCGGGAGLVDDEGGGDEGGGGREGVHEAEGARGALDG